MTWYTLFKFVHVILAVTWVGGAIIVQAFARLALASDDGGRKAQFAKDVEWVGTRIFVPASLALILAAIGLMENGDSPWTWGMNWVVFALLVWAASFVTGAAFLGPESGRLGKLIEEQGAEAPEVAARIRRILAVSRVELVFLIAVVWAMVVKPIGNAGWFWSAVVVTVVAAGAVVANYLRTEAALGAGVPTAD
jgi:uncharacterized membrane protein